MIEKITDLLGLILAGIVFYIGLDAILKDDAGLGILGVICCFLALFTLYRVVITYFPKRTYDEVKEDEKLARETMRKWYNDTWKKQ